MSAQLRTRPMSRKTVYRKLNALNNEVIYTRNNRVKSIGRESSPVLGLDKDHHHHTTSTSDFLSKNGTG